MNQGIGRLAFYSLVRVGKGFLLALAIGTPARLPARALAALPPRVRPDHPVPAADLAARVAAARPRRSSRSPSRRRSSRSRCARCGRPSINTAVGVRSINPDYLNVGPRAQALAREMLRKIIVPATLPYVFTGYRLSLGLAWLVIVAAEMLTGTPGVGGFLWQEYNSLVYSHILLSVITIGAIGFVLDRLMGAGRGARARPADGRSSRCAASRSRSRTPRGTTRVLGGVDLALDEGEFVAIVGYSGLGQDHARLADRRAHRPGRRRDHARRRAGRRSRGPSAASSSSSTRCCRG